ncbi:MAG: hypothetical protein LBM70_03565 [Victivallales bacterium]|jgi:outer membrane lipoprotein-sorting protein|nr:hypothetical protein [Victivallales bacterium]
MQKSQLKLAFRFGAACLFALGSLVLSGCNSLPEEELYPVDVKLETIEKNMQKALDPEGRYVKAKSYFQRQISVTERGFAEDPEEMLTDVWFVEPDKLKMVSNIDNKPVSGIVINGKNGWQCDYANKRNNKLDEDQMKQVKNLILIANPESSLSSVFDEISISGCIMGDEDYYRLSCKINDENPNIPLFYIYIDKEDYLIKAYRVGESVSKIVRYGMHEGVKIPVEIATESQGVKTKVTVVDYQLDVTIPLTEFYPPIYR